VVDVEFLLGHKKMCFYPINIVDSCKKYLWM